MEKKTVAVELRDDLTAREAAEILRAVRRISVRHEAGDSFPYDVGSFFDSGEGCVTYKAGPDGDMEMTFTPFHPKDRILMLEGRVQRLEGFCASLREGFPQLANVVAYDVLKEAADVLGPIPRN